MKNKAIYDLRDRINTWALKIDLFMDDVDGLIDSQADDEAGEDIANILSEARDYLNKASGIITDVETSLEEAEVL